MEISFKNQTYHDQISEDIKNFIEKKENCDVTIHCRDGGKVFGGHISEGRVILSLIWSTIICKLMEANVVLNVLLVQY